jgi:hypothetical protein
MAAEPELPPKQASVIVDSALELDQRIWRYIKLEQLLAMLRRDRNGNHTLHFSPLCTMQDLAEKFMSPQAVRETAEKLPPHVTGNGEVVVGAMAARWREDMCVNCWCMCNYQSAALWSLYAGARGLAIESTVRRLRDCFNEPQDLLMGITLEPVRYYTEEQADEYLKAEVWGSRAIKWSSFDYEREIRATVIRSQNMGSGADVPIDLSQLIVHLFVSPEAGDWIVPVVRDVVRQYGLDFPVEKASLRVLR